MADPGRHLRDLGLFPLGGSPRLTGRGTTRPAGAASQPAAQRRPAHVLLPVPRAGGPFLRRAALLVRLPRPHGPRDRRPAAAALGDAARGGNRHTALLPGHLTSAPRARRGLLPRPPTGRSAR